MHCTHSAHKPGLAWPYLTEDATPTKTLSLIRANQWNHHWHASRPAIDVRHGALALGYFLLLISKAQSCTWFPCPGRELWFANSEILSGAGARGPAGTSPLTQLNSESGLGQRTTLVDCRFKHSHAGPGICLSRIS